MKDHTPHKPDFSLLPFEARPADFEQKVFGWRQSVHSGWISCQPRGCTDPNGWPFEGAEFLCRLGEEDPNLRIKVVATSRKGKVIKEVFMDPSDSGGVEDRLFDLEPETVNLLFDPVPWVDGKRKKDTRFGWLTISGQNPLGTFPEPVAYWAVGPHAYQSLIPWHMPVKLKDSCKNAENALRFSGSISVRSKEDDLLIMPGSIVHAGHLPPFTAFMKYDMFSVTEVGDPDAFWTQY